MPLLVDDVRMPRSLVFIVVVVGEAVVELRRHGLDDDVILAGAEQSRLRDEIR